MPRKSEALHIYGNSTDVKYFTFQKNENDGTLFNASEKNGENCVKSRYFKKCHALAVTVFLVVVSKNTVTVQKAR